jgi:hypothetical protein
MNQPFFFTHRASCLTAVLILNTLLGITAHAQTNRRGEAFPLQSFAKHTVELKSPPCWDHG